MDKNNEFYGINMTKKRLISNMNRNHTTVFLFCTHIQTYTVFFLLHEQHHLCKQKI